MTIIPFSQIVEANGKTIRENNMERKHKIPIGTLVEVKFDKWFGNGGCLKVHARLWVDSHDRDCDGTPLYSLRNRREEWDLGRPFASKMIRDMIHGKESGFFEESLKVIEITEELERGEDVLRWKEDEK